MELTLALNKNYHHGSATTYQQKRMQFILLPFIELASDWVGIWIVCSEMGHILASATPLYAQLGCHHLFCLLTSKYLRS